MGEVNTGLSHDSDEGSHARPRSSMIVTLLVFMLAVGLVRYVMPPLVEEVHYSIERGRQRAHHEQASQLLGTDPLADLSMASQLISQRIAPSVVHIETARGAVPDRRDLAAGMGEESIQGQGSGVIIAPRQIITNYHVIQGVEEIQVTFSDDRTAEASVVGVDRDADLALLQVDEKDAKGLVPATWGDSDRLAEGSMVWAAGSPFGLSKTITFGILSAKGRRSYEGRGRFQEYLQSDAFVSAGNSGGPLVDSGGNVVGINTAIIGPTFRGISFAIPANRAKEALDKVLTKKPNVRHGWLGVQLAHVPAAQQPTVGALIQRLVLVKNRSPAEEAGLKRGDIITKWGNDDVNSPDELRHLVAKTSIDTTVDVAVKRDGDEKKLKVRVTEKPLQF